MRTMSQQAGGIRRRWRQSVAAATSAAVAISAGGGRPPGGGQPGGGFVVSGASPQTPRAAPVTDYQFGGEYWVIALRGDQTVPVAVKTGLTDLEYSEIVSGLEPGDKVLLLPSASLYEQQERLQEFINQRFGSTTPFQQTAAAAKLQPRGRMFR